MKRNNGLKSTVFFLAVIALGETAACSHWNRDSGKRILVSGNIELTQVNLAFKVPGRLVDLKLREGDRIAQGSIVARLDPVQIERQRERDRAALAAAESQLVQLETGIQYQKSALEADIDLKKAEIRQAQARLDEMLAGSRKQEIQLITAAVDEARSQHSQTQKDWERAQALFKNDDISASQHDQFRTRFNAASAALRQSEQRLALVVEGPRKEEIEMARAQLERAQAGLRYSEASRLELRRREQERETRRAEIVRALAQVGVIDAQLDDMILKAPFTGMALVKSAEIGEVLAAGTTLGTIGDLDRPWIRAYVSEQDLGRVKLGAKVKISTDSYPGKTYSGRVSFISSEAEFTPKQIQTSEERVKLVYRIKIEVENPQQELKLNMPVDAEIQLP